MEFVRKKATKMVDTPSRLHKAMGLLVCAVFLTMLLQRLPIFEHSRKMPQSWTYFFIAEVLPSLPATGENLNKTKFRLTPSGRYLTNGEEYFNGRLGNQLFKLAALIFVANITERQLFLTRYVIEEAKKSESTFLFQPIFEVERAINIVNQFHKAAPNSSLIGPISDVAFTGQDLSFDKRILTLYNRSTISGGDLFNVSIVRLTSGYYQSWRYVEQITNELRRVLRPKPEIVDSVSQYFESVKPRNWTDYKRVGIHIRAGDIQDKGAQKSGYSIPSAAYYERVLRQIISDGNDSDTAGHRQRRRYQLFVASDDLPWSRRKVNLVAIADNIIADHTRWSSDGSSHVQRAVEFSVIYSTDHDAGFDLIALSMCDLVVMSTGTFGWWAGWLSGKTTFYYKRWPTPGTKILNSLFTRYDFFPPSWIGVDAPIVTFRK